MIEPNPRVVVIQTDESLIWQAIEYWTAREDVYGGTLALAARSAYTRTLTQLETITAERDEARKERDALKVEAKRMRELINRTLVGALGVLHGGKVEVKKIEVDVQPDTEKEKENE